MLRFIFYELNIFVCQSNLILKIVLTFQYIKGKDNICVFDIIFFLNWGEYNGANNQNKTHIQLCIMPFQDYKMVCLLVLFQVALVKLPWKIKHRAQIDKDISSFNEQTCLETTGKKIFLKRISGTCTCIIPIYGHSL